MDTETKIKALLVFASVVTAIFGYMVVAGFLLWTP
jgi:hypothetical protein